MASLAHPGLDQLERDRRARTARADKQRPHPPGIDAPRPRGTDEAQSIHHVAMPCAVRPPAHQVDGFQEMRARRRARAGQVAGKFVRDGHHDAVEILQPCRDGKEIPQVGGRDLNRHENAVMATRREFSGYPRGRAHLSDGIAHDDVEPRRAGWSRDHAAGAGASGVNSSPSSLPSLRHLSSSRRNAIGPRQYWLFRAATGSNTPSLL